MRTSAITALLLAGAASVVSAAPGTPPKQETAERVTYSADSKGPARTDDWVELASPTPARHGREFITVDGRYVQLRIDAHAGRPVVQSVRVVYADGTQRVVKVRRALAGKRATARIDLDPARAIAHVVVVTDWRSKGTYTVRGAPAAGTGVATR